MTTKISSVLTTLLITSVFSFGSISVLAAAPIFDDSQASILLSLINNYRTSNGKSALKYNSKLAGVAKSRISAMYSAQALISPSDHTHNIPGFGGFSSHSVALGLASNTATENFTATSGDINKAFSNWINSPGHLANITDDTLVYSGMAVSTNLGDIGDPQIPSGVSGIIAIQVFSTAEGIEGKAVAPQPAPTPTTTTNPPATTTTTNKPETKAVATVTPKPATKTVSKPAPVAPKPKIDKSQKLNSKLKFDEIGMVYSKIFGN